MKLFIFSFSLLVLLSGCQQAKTMDPSSQYFSIPTSTTISLLEPLTIPANTAHVLLQGGKETSAGKLKQYHPFCRFEVNKLSETPQTVQPNTYSFRSIQSDFNVVSMPDVRYYFTRFNVRPDKDPNVLQIECGQWSQMDDVSTYLTVDQMQTALGDRFKITLPQASAVKK